MSQKLRILYLGLCETIANLGNDTIEEGIEEKDLIDLSYRDYTLLFDKKNGRIFAKREEEIEGEEGKEEIGLDLLGEIEHYTVKRVINKERNKHQKVSKFLVRKLLIKLIKKLSFLMFKDE